MRKFQYSIINKDGIISKGEGSYSDIDAVRAEVYRKGNYLLKVKSKRDLSSLYFTKRIKGKALFLFCRHIGTILQVGIPIIDALEMSVLQFNKGLLKENINFIISELKKGSTLGDSVEKCIYPFPDFFQKMVKVGERSGSLDIIFLELSEHYYKEYKLNKKIINASIYPIFVLASSIIGSAVLMTTFVPSIVEMTTSLNAQLPFMTRLMIDTSNFLKNNLTVITAFLIVFVSILTFLKSKKIIDIYLVIRKLPFISTLCKRIAAYKFLKAVYLFIKSGGTIVEGFEAAAEITKWRYLKKKLIESVNSMKEGNSIIKSLESVEMFDFTSLSIIRLGEDTGKLDTVLEKLLVMEDDAISENLNKICDLIHPISIILMSLIVGTIVLSVALPMFSMYDAVG